MRKTVSLGDILLYIYDFAVIDARMYMLRADGAALIIDPNENAALLPDLEGVSRAFVYLTHEHYDHISGVNWLKSKLPCDVWCSEICASRLGNIRENLSKTFPFLFLQDKEKYDYVRKELKLPYTCVADHTFAEELHTIWHGHTLYARKAGGHSPGGSLLLLDGRLLFGGDSLLGNGLELKSLGADREAYCTEVLPYVHTLPSETIVCPGHGEITTLGELLPVIEAYITA